MTIRRGSAHYRLSLAGGGTDIGEGEGLCITLSLPWRCHVVRTEGWDQFGEATFEDGDLCNHPYGVVRSHPILRHLPNVEPQHHFIVTHELPTRVGLGSSAALALAAHGTVPGALEIDSKATGAGWQDVYACNYNGAMCFGSDGATACIDSTMKLYHPYLLLFSTGGTHTTPKNSELDPLMRKLALHEAHKLRDDPTLETLAWCMRQQWERKMAHAPDELLRAIKCVSETRGFLSAKSTGSRGAGFGCVLTTDREKARDALVECGALVWLV